MVLMKAVKLVVMTDVKMVGKMAVKKAELWVYLTVD